MLRSLPLVSVLALFCLAAGCDSSTGPKEDVDPRWSGPTRVVVLSRHFDLANASSTESITVRFDTPDLSAVGNVVDIERSASHPAHVVTTKVNGMKRVSFEIQLPPEGETTLELSWRLSLRRFDALASEAPGSPSLGADDAAAYLAASENVESGHPSLLTAAQDITQGISGDLAKVEAIVDFVRGHLDYELQSGTKGALWALENRRGDCTEYATLGVALGRAAGIPARVTGVENMVSSSGSSTYDNHNAAEFWVEDIGWVPVDINYTQSPVGVLPTRSVTMRWGLMTERDREALCVVWYTWRTLLGPSGQLQILDMGHAWREE